MFTKPVDLPDDVLEGALHDRWRFTAMSLEYQRIGFGSHHWLVTDARGTRLFATVDDLAAKPRAPDDTTDAAFRRLERAFATALSLHAETGLAFVIAPIPTADGHVLARLTERYCLVVHPHVTGTTIGPDGQFTSDDDRRAVLDMVVQIHRAHAGEPEPDDLTLPHADALASMMTEHDQAWRGGPYAHCAQALLRAHGSELRVLLATYRRLARSVASRPDRMVITHGEPHAANVMATTRGLVLVDWESVLLAPPERDLWDMATHDPSILGLYTAATGTETDNDALSLYRLWYDLAEIGSYLSLFRAPHGDTADAAESWKNLKYFLRPAERWPALWTK